MSHDTHTQSKRNQDLDVVDGDKSAGLDYYLSLSCDWQDPSPPPTILHHSPSDVMVIREDLVDGKMRAGDLLVQRTESDHLVYVAPRFGHAALALAKLAKRYGKKLTLFMPAAKQISEHQAVAIELGAEPIFMRIAAMPNLNKAAREYAESKRATFIPLGLRHELVTAALVRTAWNISNSMGHQPLEFWCAVSTGVLMRSLQIAWPDAVANGVAVARNIHEGERGDCELYSYPRAFAQDSLVRPDFPCASNYDAKAWHTMLDHKRDGVGPVWFWNVAGEMRPTSEAWYHRVDSDAKWGEIKKPKFPRR